MKYLLIISLGIALSGCIETRTSHTENGYEMPEELRDCQIFDMKSSSERDIIAMRCPNSTTTVDYNVQSGKTRSHRTSIVVDGVTYTAEQSSHVENQE